MGEERSLRRSQHRQNHLSMSKSRSRPSLDTLDPCQMTAFRLATLSRHRHAHPPLIRRSTGRRSAPSMHRSVRKMCLCQRVSLHMRRSMPHLLPLSVPRKTLTTRRARAVKTKMLPRPGALARRHPLLPSGRRSQRRAFKLQQVQRRRLEIPRTRPLSTAVPADHHVEGCR